jgi:pre-mRNA-splicing factor 38A
VEYIIRQKIYDSLYWKQHCFGLSAERVVDKAVELRFVGGMFGEPQKPTDFICLVLKMLQIQPAKEIVVEFIKNDDFKYLRLLGAFYLRLVGRAVDVYQYLEPLLNDYRKVRVRAAGGTFELSHIDSLIDDMLRKDYMFDIALPRLPSRQALEKASQLDARVSVLEEEFNEAALAEEADKAAEEARAVDEARRLRGEDAVEEGERPREREKWQLDAGRERGRRERRSRSRSRGRDRRRDGRRRGGGSPSRSRSRSRDGRRRDYYGDERDGGRGGRALGGRSRSRSGDRRRGRSRSPARGRDSKRARGDEADGGGGGGDKASISVEETNKLRASLGLAPLK